MREYFDSILKIARVMLRSNEMAVSDFGAAMYRYHWKYLDNLI